MYTYVQIFYAYTHTCIHPRIYTHSHICIHTHTYTHAHTYSHTHTRMLARTHSHTHTHVCAGWNRAIGTRARAATDIGAVVPSRKTTPCVTFAAFASTKKPVVAAAVGGTRTSESGTR